MEMFTAIFLGDTFVVKDSFNFLPQSLEKLVSTLVRKKNANHRVLFKNLYKFFKTQNPPDEKAFDILLCKQYYPYEYMDSWEKFQSGLPPREKFFNKLKDIHLTEEEYSHVENVFKTFNMQSMRDLHNFYVMADGKREKNKQTKKTKKLFSVALLADIFENFREMSLRIYGLDPW